MSFNASDVSSINDTNAAVGGASVFNAENASNNTGSISNNLSHLNNYHSNRFGNKRGCTMSGRRKI